MLPSNELTCGESFSKDCVIQSARHFPQLGLLLNEVLDLLLEQTYVGTLSLQFGLNSLPLSSNLPVKLLESSGTIRVRSMGTIALHVKVVVDDNGVVAPSVLVHSG